MRIRWLALGFVVVVLAAGTVRAEDDPPSFAVANEGPASQTGEPIDAGFLIVDGEYLPPPYTVALDEDGLSINGYSLPNLRFREWEDTAMLGLGERSLPRRPEDNLARLERRLAHGELVIRSAEGKVALFQADLALHVFSLTFGSGPRSERLAGLLRLPGHEFGSRDWGRVLDRCVNADRLRTRADELSRSAESDTSGVAIVHDGRNRSFSYALTVIGMLLVVLAFGTVLTFRPIGQQPWRSEDRSETSVTLVLRCVVLMVVLSGFDLACTYLARSNNQFSELNPLADSLLDSPAVLIGFKVAMTGLAALILWRLRFYRGTQVASWWLCLLLTLLAVRWVAVESLLMA